MAPGSQYWGPHRKADNDLHVLDETQSIRDAGMPAVEMLSLGSKRRAVPNPFLQEDKRDATLEQEGRQGPRKQFPHNCRASSVDVVNPIK